MSTEERSDGRRSKGRQLSDEDRALWDHVVRDVDPLPRSQRRAAGHGTTQRATPRPPIVPLSDPPAAPNGGRALAPSGPPARTPGPAPKPSGGLALFERKRARKVAAGRIAIDARLDLHGLRQADAHDALVSFVVRSVARGCRTVLVITGKGGAAEAPRETGLEPRGVLRRNVPRWLAEPVLARHVVSWTEAHVRHGGAGALYIHLRVPA